MNLPGSPTPPSPAPGRTPKPPWWFFAAIGAAVVAAAVIFIVRSGGDKELAAASSPSPTASVESSPTGPTASPVPSPTPVQSPSPTPPASPTPEPTSSALVPLGASCFSSEGYGIDYPAGWFTPTRPAWVCQLFDPEPFQVQAHTEPPVVAVNVYVERLPFSELIAAYADPEFYDVIFTEQGTFADQPGMVLETVQTQELFFPAGTRTYAVLVDLLDRTIIVSTYDLALSDYERNKQTVLAMAQSLSLAG